MIFSKREEEFGYLVESWTWNWDRRRGARTRNGIYRKRELDSVEICYSKEGFRWKGI